MDNTAENAITNVIIIEKKLINNQNTLCLILDIYYKLKLKLLSISELDPFLINRLIYNLLLW